ncbi:LysM peptidoglycan-binding domain-containing protein [Gordonia sp. NPDC003376]
MQTTLTTERRVGTPTDRISVAAVPRPAAGVRGADRHPVGRRPGGRGALGHPGEVEGTRAGVQPRGFGEPHTGERRAAAEIRSRGRVVAGRAGAMRGGAGRVACADPVRVPVSTASRGVLSAVHRRRRTTAVAVMTGAALAMLVWIVAIAGSDYQRAAVPSPVSTQVVHVRAGESLGSIAARVAPDMPTRVVIDEIVELNDMAGSGLQVGQPLLTPRYR